MGSARMQVQITTLAGRQLTSLPVSPTTTGLELKQELAEFIGAPAWRQRLVHSQSTVSDGLSLHDAGVEHGDHICSIVCGCFVLTCSFDHTAKLWDTQTGECTRTFAGHEGPVCTAVFSTDGTRLLTASEDGEAKLWCPETGSCFGTFHHSSSLMWAAVSLELDAVVAADGEGSVISWVITSGQPLYTWQCENPMLGGAVPHLHRDGTHVLVTSNDCSVRAWSLQTGLCTHTFTGHAGVVFHARYSEDAAFVVTASDDLSIKLWDAASGKERQSLDIGADVCLVDLSPDGRIVLAASDSDFAVTLWKVSDGELLGRLAGHTKQLRAATFSTDSSMVATACNDCTAKIWSIFDSTCLHSLTAHAASVFAVSFGIDGQLLLTASEDCTVKLWTLDSGACLQTLVGHRSPVAKASFAP